METFTRGEEINGYFTELSAGKNAQKGIPGTVVEVKMNTSILVCEFKLKGTTIVEDFTLEGISIRGEAYGHIVPLTSTIQKPESPKKDVDTQILELLEEARVAFTSDDKRHFELVEKNLAGIGAPQKVVTLMGIIMDYCKSGEKKPSAETMQAIQACLRK